MVILRKMSSQGVDRFREYIQSLKNAPQLPHPDLNTEPYSHEFQPLVDIDETKNFSTRIEIGRYLTGILQKANTDRSIIIENSGIWTWLAYLWFGQLCPLRQGNRKIRESARYICSTDYTDYFRHYVAGAYDIYSLYGEPLSFLFLKTPIDEISDFVEVFACRQNIISNKNLIELIHHLYWDVSSDRPKSGSVARNKPGNIRRLVKVIQQLEVTYDIYSMIPHKILSLLPSEFNIWKRYVIGCVKNFFLLILGQKL